MNRLRAYRDIEGLNQADLAELLSVSPQMVSHLENGRRQFTGDLAPLGYGAGRFELPDMSEPLHRHRASTLVSAKRRARELLRLGGEVYYELRHRTAKAPHVLVEEMPAPRSHAEIEDLAIETRVLLGHEERGPIRNLTSLVERAGIALLPMRFLEGIDGLSAWVDGTPVVGLNPSVPGDRFRLTLAHELAHLLFHRTKSATCEAEANRFAAALLIPRDDFDEAMPNRPMLRDFVGLKASWGVSVAALVYRAHELDYIDDARYRALQIQMSKWRKSEPGTFDPIAGQLLPRLVEVNGGVSAVADALEINEAHLRDITDWTVRRLQLVGSSRDDPPVVLDSANSGQLLRR